MKIRDPADGARCWRPAPWASCGQGTAGGEAGSTGTSPEATAETFVDGWVAPATWRASTKRASCFIIDRAKDMLIRGGENIYCIEVENVLYDHPAVMDAALVGIPHKTLGEEPARWCT
jgi:long-chain acyl-CoA synthetase